MNIYVQYILSFVGLITALAALAGGLGVLKKSFSKGEREEKADVISSADQLAGFWKEQVEGFRGVIAELTNKLEKQKDDHNDEMKKVLTELGEVRGRLGAETKAKDEYLAILQNRDPETKKFMEIMLDFVKSQTETNKQIAKVLSEIHKMSTDEHNRDFKITSTISKTEE